MKTDAIVTAITSLVGLATMVFGLSKEDADAINAAVPTVVGGIMAAYTTVSYLMRRSNERQTAFKEAVRTGGESVGSLSVHGGKVLDIAKTYGLL